MKQTKISKGDLLYHAVHGLCRVIQQMKEIHSGKEVLCYALVPKAAQQMKSRFIIQAEGIEASGFHPLISTREANKILAYFEAGNVTAIPAGAVRAAATVDYSTKIWEQAQVLLSGASENFEGRDQRKRQVLQRSVRAVVGELANVFNTTMRETAERIQKCLGDASKINPCVVSALENAGQE